MNPTADSSKASVQVPVKRTNRLRLFVSRGDWRQIESDNALDLDAGVARLEEQEILHQQAAADQQRERQRDLRNHQAVAHLPSRAAPGPHVSLAY
jgi:hypothetical protein